MVEVSTTPSGDAGRVAGPPERELLESWELLKALVDASPDLIWTVDAKEHRLLTFNLGLQQYFARHRGVELRLGMELRELVPEPPLTARWREFYRRAVDERGYHVPEYQTSVGGRVLDLHLRVLCCDEVPYAITAFGRDITPQVRAQAELRASERQQALLAARLQQVAEEEKTRLSRDLHDRLGQLLTGLQLDLVWLEERLEALAPSPQLGGLVDRAVAASELAERTIAEVQRIATELRPASLDRLGLGAALQHEARRFQERAGITCRVELGEPLAVLAPDAATALYRIVQEALTNVARHARAREVVIRLSTGPEGVLLAVDDDGVGIDPAVADAASSLGLAGMRERATLEGGALVLRRRAEGGTRVEARLPLAKGVARP
jgi:signal transduction histidine kinase